jgi:outer membrane protein assembly factor BamA
MILMLCAAAGFAQAPKKAAKKAAPAAVPGAPAAPLKRPIASIAVEGNKIFTREQVLAVAGLKAGQAAGKAEFEAARDRLVASGAFESVAYRYTPTGDGIAATLEVAEVEQIYPF